VFHLLVVLKLSVDQLEIEQFVAVLLVMKEIHTLDVLRILVIPLLVVKMASAREMEELLSMLSSLMLESQQVIEPSANVLLVTQATPS